MTDGGPRRRYPRSLRGRLVLSTVLLTTAVVIVLGIGVQVLLAGIAQRDIDQALSERAANVVAVVDASSPGGGPLAVPEDLVDPGVRVYDADGHLVAGSIERDVRAQADRLGSTTKVREVEAREDLRLRAEPFTTDSGQRGVVVVSQETTPYERAAAYALAATIAVGVLFIGLAALIAWRVITQALAPVAQMAERATDWSEHDLDHRFGLDESDHELAQLAATLDGLLDRVAMAIRAEQRLTSELAHELRTPLTAIQGAADLALLRGVDDADTRAELEQVAASARSMSDVITTLVDVARDRAAAGTAATCHAGELVFGVRSLVPAALELVDATRGSTARVAAPAALVLRVLAPIVDNAADHARTTVTLAAVDTPHSVEISVHDDGPGIDPGVRASLFDVGASTRGGTGLGLAIAQRVARSLGGRVTASDPAQGATFVVTLPRA